MKIGFPAKIKPISNTVIGKFEKEKEVKMLLQELYQIYYKLAQVPGIARGIKKIQIIFFEFSNLKKKKYIFLPLSPQGSHGFPFKTFSQFFQPFGQL